MATDTRQVRARRGACAVHAVLIMALAFSASGVASTGARAAAPEQEWKVVPSANPDGTNGNFLYDVSCGSANSCVAVGESINLRQSLIEMWNGTSWSLAPHPDPGTSQNTLSGVSCVSATFCIAVGISVSYPGPSHPLVEVWNGTTWSIVPNPSAPADSTLGDVSCVSSNFCLAIGRYSDATGSHPLIEKWDGTRWSIVSSPTLPVSAVSCVSPNYCVAVGGAFDGSVAKTTVETWNGTRWSSVPSPNVTSRNSLLDVSCVSVTFCVAVGSIGENGVGPLPDLEPLIEIWNGSRWLVTPTPEVFGDQPLTGVSCISANTCVAVGGVTSGQQPLIEVGPSWTLTPVADVVSAPRLEAVTCVSVARCVAVGWSRGSLQTLTMTGPAQSPPSPVTNLSAFAGVASATATWTAPAAHGSAITSYTVKANPGGASVTVPGTLRSATVNGLKNRSYTLTVTATNALGTSLVSPPSNAVTPYPAPAVAPGHAAALEGTTGTTLLQVPVTLSRVSDRVVTVHWRTVYAAGGPSHPADPATDYTAASGTLTFAPGEVQKPVTIAVRGDTVVEPDEYVVVALDHATNAYIGGFYGLGFGFITNDD